MGREKRGEERVVGKRCQQSEKTGSVGESQRDNERAHSFSVCVFLQEKLEGGVRVAAVGGANLLPIPLPAPFFCECVCLLLRFFLRLQRETCQLLVLLFITHTYPLTHTGTGCVPACPSRLPSEALSPSPRSRNGDRELCGGCTDLLKLHLSEPLDSQSLALELLPARVVTQTCAAGCLQG